MTRIKPPSVLFGARSRFSFHLSEDELGLLVMGAAALNGGPHGLHLAERVKQWILEGAQRALEDKASAHPELR